MSNKPYPDDFEWVPYARISDDREGGGLGADRQVKDCNALGERLGGKILAPCVDNDLTAYDKSARYKPRPDYDRLCELLRARPGHRGVLAWHTDRLHRNPRELEDFIDLVEQTNAPVQTVKAGQIDLSTASGRMTARVHCAVARHESEHKSERIRRKVEELASVGAIANGGPRPFGYTRIYSGEGPRRKILRDEINETEAEYVRECVKRCLAGDSLRSIVGWLNNEGVRTSTGRHWSGQAMRYMLRSGRIAGLREHNRVVVGPAVWPAIVDREQHEQLRALLDGNVRPPGAIVRTHYLSGFVYCTGTPENPCSTKMRVKRVGTELKYSCTPKAEGGCNGRLIKMTELKKLVDDYMIGRLSDPETLRELARREAAEDIETQDLLSRIEADERRLKMISDSMADDDEDELPEALAAARRIRARLAENRARLAQLAGVPTVAAESLPDLAERWPELHIDRKQGLLRLFVDRILIGPAVRGLGRFDPDRVDIIPRGDGAHGGAD